MAQNFLMTTLLVSALATTVHAKKTEQMNKQINTNAPVRCSKTMIIHASSAKVWATLTNINNWAAWQTDIAHPKLTGPIVPGSTFVWKTDGATIHSTLHTVVPFKSFGWTGKTFGMHAVHNWTLTEVNGQTTVTVDESMEGLMAMVFKKSFNNNLAQGMQHWLELLKVECEK